MWRKIFIGALIALLLLVALGAIFWPSGLVIRGPILAFLLGRTLDTPPAEDIEARMRVSDPFQLGVFATDLKTPRMMVTTARGDLIVSETRAGRVSLIFGDADGDGRSDGRMTLLENKIWPHGLALIGNQFFVAEETHVSRMNFDPWTRTIGDAEVILEGLPKGGNHRTRSLAVGPDGLLYLTTGSSCNVCEETEPHRATMIRFRADGSRVETVATGLRNSVGFDWDPANGALYATDNGRDLLGDDVPDDELNKIQTGSDYGWPYAYGNRVLDPDLGVGHEEHVAQTTPPMHGFGAHRAPLGIDFITHPSVPTELKGDALVALHGSWNRSELAGYKLVQLSFDEGGTVQERDFMTGFEMNGDVIGRPVDIEEGLDGALYVSDDLSGTIWRIGHGDLPLYLPPLAGEDSQAPVDKDEALVAIDPFSGLSEEERARLLPVGALLYATSGCASCHQLATEAPSGDGRKRLADLGTRYTVSDIENLLSVPPGNMPLYEGFTDTDRKAIAVYLLSEN